MYFDKVLVLNDGCVRVKEEAEVSEEFKEVFTHRIDTTESVEEGRGDKYKGVRIQASLVRMIQVMILEEFLQD